MTALGNPDETIPLHQIYAAEVRQHAVSLIWLGHSRLDAPSFATTDEDVITEQLVIAMKAAQVDASSPEWVDRYEIHEQRLQNTADKHGKCRPKMDIELERTGRGFRPKLGFEAKRLRENSSLRDYLGEEGMSAFLTGYYPTTHGDAGMLGYVQDSSPTSWAGRIEHQLCNARDRYRLPAGSQWQPITEPATATCYVSNHTDTSAKSLQVIHVLLPFC